MDASTGIRILVNTVRHAKQVGIKYTRFPVGITKGGYEGC